ncbi:MAG: aminotransferase class I/II-fold pyridoxal phosphate-dependent enzyme [Mariniphaga sp.]|nr:aminotransferase class I/II-fold pyridoxal phosphate-dependent enzyme [Mariniphaga sp.]
MNKKIWLASPHMGGSEQKYVKEAFDTNWIAPLGPNVDAFEKGLAKYNQIDHVAALSAGTAALHLALIMLGIEAGDEVIVSSFTFAASVNPIAYQGAIPILIDSEPDTWNMCPKQLETAILDRVSKGKKPKAIILVHLYGMPAKTDKIMTIASRYKIPVIEDAAEAMGSKFMGKPVGTFGLMGFYSFNGNKIITTSGGGALVSNDEWLISRSRFLATQARECAPHYEHEVIGYNYRMSNISAGIGRGQLEVIDDHIDRHREIFNYYKRELSIFKGITFQQEPNADYYSNYWLTCIQVNPEKCFGVTRDHIRIAMEGENIECRPLWKPMHLQPVHCDKPYYGDGVSDELFENGLCLPSGSNLSDEDLVCVVEVIKNILSKALRKQAKEIEELVAYDQ